MSDDTTQRVIREFFEAIGRGDADAVVSSLSEDIELELPRNDQNKIIPYLGVWTGREQVAEAFRLRAETLEVEEFEIRDLVAADSRGFAVVYTRARHRATGRAFEVEDAHRLEVSDTGAIRRWKAYFDAGPMVAALSANLDEQLIGAVRDEDLAEVERLLDLGAGPDARDADTGLTVLMMAACQAKPAIVRVLLDAGADVFTGDPKTGATPLHKSCQGGSVEVARLLADRGAFIDATTPTMGHTPIMDALWYKHPALVSLLVDRGADLKLSTHYGFAMMEHFDFELQVNTLGKDKLLEIKKIFDDRQALDRRTIESHKVMAATEEGDAEAVRRLIRSGEGVNTVQPISNNFNNGHTPLLVAARNNQATIVEELLAAGARVRVEDWVFKGAPIHKATYNGNPGILRMLITCPDIDIDVQGPINGYTPIHDALWHGYDECARILLDAGARLDLKGHDGKTPLDVAIDVSGPDSEIAQALRAALDDAVSAAWNPDQKEDTP